MLAWLLWYDEWALVRVAGMRRRTLTRAMRALTRLGDGSTWVVLGLVLLGSGSAAHAGVRLALGAVAAALLAQICKRGLRRRRPDVRIPGFLAVEENPDAFSFPSGHTATAVGVAVALAGEGTFLGPLFLALGGAIGASRVYLGAHYPLDVAAGMVLGVVGGGLARLLSP